MGAYLYILRCSEGSYYVGTTRSTLDGRIGQHQAGAFDCYTARRRPIERVFSQEISRIEDAIAAERQVRGWRREKKEALIRGDFAALPALSRRRAKPPARASRRTLKGAPQHEGTTLMASSKAPHPEAPPLSWSKGRPRRTQGADPAKSGAAHG